MSPPLRRRDLGTGQTSKPHFSSSVLLLYHLSEHRIHFAFDLPATMSLLGKKFPGAMGMCCLDPEYDLWEDYTWITD
jgi:hypothetical protein